MARRKPKNADPPTAHPLDGLVPSDFLMAIAWRDCLSWAIGHAETLAAFRAQTGNTWSPGRTPIDRMIDEACGADAKFLREFVEWFNVNVWGDMDIVAGAGDISIGEEP